MKIKLETWNGLSYIEGAYFCKKEKKLENDLLAVWSPLKILILKFPTLKVMHDFEDPTRYGEIRNISTVFFASNFGYLMIGYCFGIIKVDSPLNLK